MQGRGPGYTGQGWGYPAGPLWGASNIYELKTLGYMKVKSYTVCSVIQEPITPSHHENANWRL